ncbi:MAG: antitoxin [Streptosporangiales bacterium]|nr:antitoxin [Streptosporangiales bacterium]
MAGLKGLADKAKRLLGKNPDKAREGIDRAAEAVDQRTGGKHRQTIDKAAEKARQYAESGDAPRGEQEGGRQER